MVNKKDETMKKVIGGIALSLVLVLAGGICGGLLQRHFNWGEDPEVENPVDEEQPEGGSSEIETGEEQGVKMSVRKLMSSEFAAYGVSALAEDAYTLTATVYPENASNKALDWSVSFVNASSSWATGKTVTDYVTVTPTSDGALTATVENLGAFGEQIQVKATSRDNPDAYATCTVEYLQRTTGYGVTLSGPNVDVTLKSTGTTTGSVKPVFMATRNVTCTVNVIKSEVYTRENTDTAGYFTLQPEAGFVSAVEKAGLTESAVESYEYTGSTATIMNFFDKTYLTQISGESNVNKNKLIDVIDGYDGTAYTLKVYDKEGGKQLATFNLTFDASVLTGSYFVANLTLDETEIVF